MKYILLSFILLSGLLAQGQSVLPLRADTVRIEKVGGSGELQIRNATRDSLGLLVNVGGGKTRFIRAKKLNDTTLIIGLDTLSISGGAIGSQGLSNKADTIVWGGYLDSPVVIHALSTKTAYPEPNRLLRMINRGGDTVDYDINPYLPANGFGRPLAHFSRQYYMNDTLPKRYGAAVVGFTRSNLQGATRFKNPATPWDLDYGGFYGASHIFPPDSAYWYISSFGGVPAAIAGDFAIGGTIPWRVIMIPEHPGYTMPAFKSNIDLARASISVKRETIGAGYSGYLSEFKDYQANISGGTTEYGSYTPSVSGFHAYGNLYPHGESPSKAKTLAVSTVDTAIGFRAGPQWRDKNEVRTGNGFISEGVQDMSWMAGTLRLGGAWPTVPTGGQLRRFENYGTMRSTDTAIFDNRVLVGKTTSNGSGELQVDSTLRVGDNVNNTWLSVFKTQSITTGNFSTSFRTGIFFRNSFEYPAFVNVASLETSGLTAGTAHFVADSIQVGSDITTGTRVQGGVVSLLFRRLSGFTDTMLIKGGIDFTTAPTAFHPRMDMSEAGTSTSPLFFRGYYTALQPTLQLSEHNYIDNFAFINIGVGQYAGALSRVDTGYGVHILPFSSKFGVKYAFYQRGTADSLYIAGVTRMPNLIVQTDTTNYKPLVADAKGIIHRLDTWPTGSGGGGSITGSGVVNQVTYWTGTSAVAGDGGFTFNSTTNTVTSDSASHIRSIADTVLARQRIGVASLNPQSRIYAVTDALAGTSTTVAHNSSGLMLANTTAAANGAQQISPTIVLRGNGWGTTAGTSQTVDWRMINSPVQGTVPTGIFRWQVSINSATYTEPMTLTSAGQLTTSSSIVSGGSFGASATANFNWSGRSRLTSPADGSITLSNAAGTDFSFLQFGGTTSSFPSLQRSGTGLIARLADNSENTNIEILGESYGSGWDSDNGAATKNDTYDKIETITLNSLLPSQTGNGGKALVTNAANASWGHDPFPYELTFLAGGATSNAITQTIQSITIPDNSTGWIMVELTSNGITTGTTHNLKGIKYYSYEKIAGTLTIDAADVIVADKKGASVSAATWQVTTSSNNAVIEVTGVTSVTMQWRAAVKVTVNSL